MTLNYEKNKIKQGYGYIIGCDEVGRGCLAGPVVAGAVVLPIAGDKLKVHEVYKVIKDSKLLSQKKREELSKIIKNIALAWAIGEVSQGVVDEINIHNASLLAMKRAVEKLSLPGVILRPSASEAEESQKRDPSRDNSGAQDDAYKRAFVCVDGKFKIPNLNINQEAIIDGDNKVVSIAAASIIAKVYRDNLMRKLHQQYPIYNFAQHKGYATQYHRKTIIKHGLSPLHRLSFCQNLTA